MSFCQHLKSRLKYTARSDCLSHQLTVSLWRGRILKTQPVSCRSPRHCRASANITTNENIKEILNLKLAITFLQSIPLCDLEIMRMGRNIFTKFSVKSDQLYVILPFRFFFLGRGGGICEKFASYILTVSYIHNYLRKHNKRSLHVVYRATGHFVGQRWYQRAGCSGRTAPWRHKIYIFP